MPLDEGEMQFAADRLAGGVDDARLDDVVGLVAEEYVDGIRDRFPGVEDRQVGTYSLRRSSPTTVVHAVDTTVGIPDTP
jgi:hypothetical protein